MTITKHNLTGLDFETYSFIDLPKYGLFRYTAHPSFTPTLACTYRPLRSLEINHFTVEELAERLQPLLESKYIASHNAIFEKRVCDVIGVKVEPEQFVDSAVIARALGASGKLAFAAPQLLGINKLASGKQGINLFGKPQPDQVGESFDPQVIKSHPVDWTSYMTYCSLDAELSWEIAHTGIAQGVYTETEHRYATATLEMNLRGWPVDIVTVREMQRRYLENLEMLLDQFRVSCDAPDLNLNSLPQMKAWCAERGINARSFDEANVTRLLDRIRKKLGTMAPTDSKLLGYDQVCSMLYTKQALGGSSLKKLQTMLDTELDGRLYDQYVHIGAGQSFRTSGRSVQMQNLKKLSEPAAMDTLMDDDVNWDNETMASNLRQVFTSSSPQGVLIVGDFKSVESRGLAWLANAQWKLDAYRQGQDLYKVLATKIYQGVAYDAVTAVQRTTGKVGELSCGYYAGADAVRAFAAKMHVELTEGEAAQLVSDWRTTNPEVEQLWKDLDNLIQTVVGSGVARQNTRVNLGPQLNTGPGAKLYAWLEDAPASLQKQAQVKHSLWIRLANHDGIEILRRVFHGAHMRGRNMGYFKPRELVNGELWSNHFTDPKTKEVKFYSLYGGKLSGILTQSLCRELFFHVLLNVNEMAEAYSNIEVVGQFHDEIVVDWWPMSGKPILRHTKKWLTDLMEQQDLLREFPLEADIKHAYRYIK